MLVIVVHITCFVDYNI
jgi:hypothetical protein